MFSNVIYFILLQIQSRFYIGMIKINHTDELILAKRLVIEFCFSQTLKSSPISL